MMIYYSANGAIGAVQQIFDGEAKFAEQEILAGKLVLLVPNGAIASGQSQYVKDGELADRPALSPPAEGVVEGVPPGTQVIVNGEIVGSCEDGVVSFEGNEPGSYEVTLRPPFPTRDLAFSVVIP